MSDFHVAGVSPTLNLKPGRIDADKYREIFEFLSEAGAELEGIDSGFNGAFSTLTLSFVFQRSFGGKLNVRPMFERMEENKCSS